MQSYYSSHDQPNEKTAVNLMARRLSDKWDRETKRFTNGFIKLGLPGSKVKKGTSGASSSSSSPSTTSTTSTTSSTKNSIKTPNTMQFQPSFNIPFVPPVTKDWHSSSIYAQVRHQQDMKCKIEALEQRLKHDQQVFEEERAVLLKEIKIKDNQICEKEQQWDSLWATKLHELEHQMDLERKEHECSILEWKARYQAAMDTEQQKHYRRLAYFHERLTAKNAEYAELEQQLASNNTHSNEDARPRRSTSLESGLFPRHGILSSTAKRHSSSAGLLAMKDDDLYARELQDMSLRHQASVDNMAAEYEVDRTELLAQHHRDKQVWKIEHDAELRAVRSTMAQEHDTEVGKINQAWQQKWDAMVAQNMQEQDRLKQEWNQQLAAEKRSWEDRQTRDNANLKKKLGWSTYELSLMIKEHTTALALAKQLNLAINHDADVEDMKYTLTSLLEAGIKNASQMDSTHSLSKKSSNSLFSGFMNLAVPTLS
ncbi:hypothetical protein [Absidia glauca]|uniref:Uncharacterized protein n=1 Tax=Absidia glauca TaxID=4829 RepID=A0A168T4K8_ABSGL|nr:hypothetical protein [Absidia glauca]